MTELIIVASIKAKTYKKEQIKAEIEKLINLTRAESGCICYDLHRDNHHSAHFLIYERWASREAWQTHLDTMHMQAFKVATQDAIEEFSFNELTKIA